MRGGVGKRASTAALSAGRAPCSLRYVSSVVRMVPSVATSAASLAPASGRYCCSVSTVAVVDITYLYSNVPARATTTRTIRISIRPKPRFTDRIVLRPAGHGPAPALLLELLAEIFERFARLASGLADGLLRLAGYTVRGTFGFEISIAGHLTRFLIHVPLGLLDFAFHLVLVHGAPPWATLKVQRGCQRPLVTLFLLRAEHRSADERLRSSTDALTRPTAEPHWALAELVQIHVRRYRARSEGCFTEGGTPRDESLRAHLAVPSPGEVPALAVVGRGSRPPARSAALGRDGEPRVGDAHLCRESGDALSLATAIRSARFQLLGRALSAPPSCPHAAVAARADRRRPASAPAVPAVGEGQTHRAARRAPSRGLGLHRRPHPGRSPPPRCARGAGPAAHLRS